MSLKSTIDKSLFSSFHFYANIRYALNEVASHVVLYGDGDGIALFERQRLDRRFEL